MRRIFRRAVVGIEAFKRVCPRNWQDWRAAIGIVKDVIVVLIATSR